MTSTRLSLGQLLREGRRVEARDELLLIGYGPNGPETLREMWTKIRDERASGRLAGHETLHVELQWLIGSVGREVMAAIEDGQAETEREAAQERAAYYDKMRRDENEIIRVAKSKDNSAKPARISQDGIYRDPDSGVIYKVQFNKGEGDGRRLYAKKLVVAVEPEYEPCSGCADTGYNPKSCRECAAKPLIIVKSAVIRFEYASGAVNRLRPEWKLTLEQAKEFGALYGNCVRCGRDLTREDSIARMMGSTCYAKMGW
jgi:Family of unknown function (DUF6011)